MTAVDHHGYAAFMKPASNTVEEACDFIAQDAKFAAEFRANGIEVWWGEWALATDDCAHWLQGFNNNHDHYSPSATCKPGECPYSYLPADEFDTSFDRNSTEPLGPYGGGDYGPADMTKVGITNGTCWDDSAHFSFEQVD